MNHKKTNKRQHFIPECYLKAWFDPEFSKKDKGVFWLFGKDGSFVRRMTPSNTFVETDFYTKTEVNGERDLSLEDRLSRVETLFGSLRMNKLIKHVDLTLNDKGILAVFIATLHVRTQKRRDRNKSIWKNVLDLGDKMIEWEKNATPEQRENLSKSLAINQTSVIETLTYEEVKLIADQPVQVLMDSEVDAFTRILFGMNLSILFTTNKRGFITSDSPVVLSDPEIGRNGFRGYALGSQTIRILCPLTPSLLVLFSHKHPEGYFEIEDIVLEEINRLARISANKYFIVNSKLKEPYWFSKFIDARLLIPKKSPFYFSF
jgi:hypothetical protein